MNIGIVCYASVGGSGIVATELAKALAARGHGVHVLSTDPPFRFGQHQPGVWFHRVNTPAYPLFREPQYVISLATRIVQVAREFALEVVHAHYAVPHATAAYLAKQIMMQSCEMTHVPRVITTLHGTDITLVGSDPSYLETVAFSIDQSDGVTAVSQSLKDDTCRSLGVDREIEVIPNFLECAVYRRTDNPDLRARYCPPPCEKIIVHMSNFRPVKRPRAVVEIFARIAARVPSRLLLVGDGPELDAALDTARRLGVADSVKALGEQEHILPLLSIADLFLLPSEQESFGLSALEAMACEVPVIASRVGGLGEVVEDGVTGYLHAPEDLDEMAASGVHLLTDAALHARFAAAGRRVVTEQFCSDRVVPMYEAFYERLVSAEA
ncbi:MAG TPA: N-acetyl-alpha-D-glucosaminyl L-malate synthase BshA [Vicinamibacterales bacterium]